MRLLAGKYAVLNLIPYNAVRRPRRVRAGRRASARQPSRATLHRRGVLTKLRHSAGQDVEAGCGQLRARAVTVSTQELRGL